MSPWQFLILMLAMTLIAGGLQFIHRRRQMQALRELANELQMHYSPDDRFRLWPRIVQRLPAPGAAGVRVADLLYGVEGENNRYIFRTEYTLGVLRSKVSVQRIATFSEPRERSGKASDIELTFAPAELPLMEQYKYLAAKAREVCREDVHAI